MSRKTLLTLMLAAAGAIAQEEAPGGGEPASPPPTGDLVPVETEVPAGEAPAEPKGKLEGVQGEESYTIVKGDTLWDISEKFLGNPWYWPKIWSANPYIENPHWIYPGNKLTMREGGEKGPTEVVPAEPAAGAGEGTPAEEADEFAGVPPPPKETMSDFSVGKIDEQSEEAQEAVQVGGGRRTIGLIPTGPLQVRHMALLISGELEDTGEVYGSFEQKEMLATWDNMYVKFKRQVRPGEKFVIYKREPRAVKHPITGELIGYMVEKMGSVKVLASDAEGLATCVVETSNGAIERGDKVGPWGDPISIRVAPRPNTRTLEGIVVAAEQEQSTMQGEHHVVYIDKGKNDGVVAGNSFVVHRRGDGLTIAGAGESAAALSAMETELPPEEIAKIVIFDVRDVASAGLVVKSLREIEVGDKVVMQPERGGSGGK
jgi:hypothetical protein